MACSVIRGESREEAGAMKILLAVSYSSFSLYFNSLYLSDNHGAKIIIILLLYYYNANIGKFNHLRVSPSIKSSISLPITLGISLLSATPKNLLLRRRKKFQKNNPENIWWFQNNDVLLQPKSSIKSCPVAAHQPSFA